MTDVRCARCGSTRPALPEPPLPGEWGAALQAETCADCWQAWTEEQTRLINHFGLKPFLPADKRTIYRHLHEFLKLTRVQPPA
jgi:Fe-S cluster biosynthesis and repair protein YggX